MSPSVSVRLLLTQSDERLVGYARAGHERAFEALVQRYRRQLFDYCRRLLLSEQRAEDALQQALLQAWIALRDGAEVRDVRPWLYRIVHNTAVGALRVSRYDYCQLSESLSGADAPQQDLDRRIAVREALAGLAALPQMQREALLRTAVEGRSHQQVAGELGLSEPALRGLVYRARTALRAAAGAIVPPPALSWALEAGTRGTPALERVAGVAGGSSSAGLAGLLLKGGAVAVTAGALAGGLAVTHAHKVRAHAAATRAKAHPADGTNARAASLPAQPAAFVSSTGAAAPTVGRRRSQAPGGARPAVQLSSERRNAPRSRMPAPVWAGGSRGDGGPPVESPRLGSHDGGGTGSSSREGHGDGFGSGPGSGGLPQKDDDGSSSGGSGDLGGGSTGSGSSGQDGSGDPSGKTSGAEPSTGGDGSDGKDGSGDLRQPPEGFVESSVESGPTSGTGSKDGADISEGAFKKD